MTDTHSSTNQRSAEPVPSTPAHSVPSSETPERAAPSSGAVPVSAGEMPAIAREGLADGETDNVVPPTGTLA